MKHESETGEIIAVIQRVSNQLDTANDMLKKIRDTNHGLSHNFFAYISHLQRVLLNATYPPTGYQGSSEEYRKRVIDQTFPVKPVQP
jgi:hypothetical protein